MWSFGAQRVRSATSVLEVRTALGQLEANLHEEYVSPQFKRKPTPVKGAWLTTGAHCHIVHLTGPCPPKCLHFWTQHMQLPLSEWSGEAGKAAGGHKQAAAEAGEGGEALPAAADAQVLEWLPPTVAAVGLRLSALDAALIYSPGVPPARDTLQVTVS